MTDSLYPHEEAIKLLLEECPLWLSLLGFVVFFDTLVASVSVSIMISDFMTQSNIATLGYQMYVQGGFDLLAILSYILLSVSTLSFTQTCGRIQIQ